MHYVLYTVICVSFRVIYSTVSKKRLTENCYFNGYQKCNSIVSVLVVYKSLLCTRGCIELTRFYGCLTRITQNANNWTLGTSYYGYTVPIWKNQSM